MATVTDTWVVLDGGAVEADVTYNNANGNIQQITVTNGRTTDVVGTVTLIATGQTFSKTFPPGTTSWNPGGGFKWGSDSPAINTSIG